MTGQNRQKSYFGINHFVIDSHSGLSNGIDKDGFHLF